MDDQDNGNETAIVPEVMQPGVMAAIVRSEIDIQIATAKRYPRSVTEFQREAMSLAGNNVDAAEECMYSLSRGGKSIIGPSARFAEILAYSWGNCRAAARVVDVGETFLTAQGMFSDLQRNVGIQYEVQRRITNTEGKRFKDDMIVVTSNAACSIGLRNAVLKGIPRAVWSPIFDQVLKTLKGDAKTLEERRDSILNHFTEQGVKQADIFLTLGVKGLADIGFEQLTVLHGIKTAIKEGDTTIKMAFSQDQDEVERLRKLRKNPDAPAAAAGSGKIGTEQLNDDDIPK